MKKSHWAIMIGTSVAMVATGLAYYFNKSYKRVLSNYCNFVKEQIKQKSSERKKIYTERVSQITYKCLYEDESYSIVIDHNNLYTILDKNTNNDILEISVVYKTSSFNDAITKYCELTI